MGAFGNCSRGVGDIDDSALKISMVKIAVLVSSFGFSFLFLSSLCKRIEIAKPRARSFCGASWWSDTHRASYPSFSPRRPDSLRSVYSTPPSRGGAASFSPTNAAAAATLLAAASGPGPAGTPYASWSLPLWPGPSPPLLPSPPPLSPPITIWQTQLINTLNKNREIVPRSGD